MCMYHFKLYSADPDHYTCLDVVLYTGGTNGYKFQLGPCVPSHKLVYDTSKYIEKCCIPNGNYLLSCHHSGGSGWLTNSFVGVGRHRFCDDHTGYTVFRSINIPGMY